ncbi:MAG: hypothetical protein WCR07_15630 [Verrucomicrobiota bacterium]
MNLRDRVASSVVLAGILVPAWAGWAQTVPRTSLPGSVVAPFTARDVSGQFVISGGPPPETRVGLIPEALPDLEDVPLQAQWMAVAADRTRRTLTRLLDLPEGWRGKIFVNIHDAGDEGGKGVHLRPVQVQGAWNVRLDLPSKLPWKTVVRVLVDALLVEMANREPGAHVGVVPLWVSEGMTGLVLADRGRDLVVEGHTAVMRNAVKPEWLAEVRKVLAGRSPLLLDEMAFPPAGMASDAAAHAAYRASSTLLCHELLGGREGRRAFNDFLAALPRHENWQMAFLQAHRGRFLTMLEAEKWWAVNSLHVLGRDPARVWGRGATLAHLDALLVENAEIRVSTNAPASFQSIRLADLVVKWDRDVQRDVVRRKLSQLRSMQQHAAKEILPLVADYHRALQALDDPNLRPESDALRRNEMEPRWQRVASKVARELRVLDVQLAEWKKLPPEATAPVAQRRRRR